MDSPSKEPEVGIGSPIVDTVPTDPEEIRALVKKQIEYYFSKENLGHDAYLTSQMDAQMSAPISVIMKFGKIKTLTQDEAVLREALADSTAVSIVDDRIKSNLKSTGRSTIILRDIASDVPEEEVRSIFAYDGCKPISSVRKDIENTWFVFMDSEEDAKDTVLDLKLKKRMFRGEPVKCRLKTEVVVKSYFPVASQSASSQAGYSGSGGYGMMPQYAQDMRMYSGYGWQNGQQNGDFNKGDIDSPGRSSGSVQSKDGASRAAAPSPKDGVRKDQLKAGGSRDGNVGRDRIKQGVGATQQQRGKDGSGRNQVPGRNGQSGKTGKGEKGMWVEGGKAGHRAPSFDLSGMNFPPLATSEGATAIPQPGYKGPFTKYTHDEIIHIVKNISKVVLPSSIEPELHGDAMTHTVNMDLLHRQRTFSIDETREQLRQGKPVQREAVVSGAVDMESMYYGDSVAPNVPPAPVVPTVPTTTSSSSTKPSGSWAGVLMKSGPPEVAPQKIAVAATPKKVPVEPVVAAVPEVVAVEDKKGDAKPLSGDKKGKGKDNKGKDGKRRGSEGTEAPPTETQTSWGGKPSFATILKQQEEASTGSSTPTKEDVARAAPGPSTPSRKGKSADVAPASSGAGWNNRNSKPPANSKSGNNVESKIKENASDGSWVREKLPPVQDKA